MVPLALSVGAHADSMAAVLPTKPPPLVLRI
jgi:hypothetical protein